MSAGPVTLHRSAANGLIGQITAGDVTEQWSSNEFGERSRMGSQFDADELLTLTATRDALGRIVTQVEGTGEDARTTTYAYTPEGWLASATTVDAEGDVVAQHTYDYDANGNLTLRDGVALQHGPGDELLGIGEDTAFTYGPDGALETRTDTHGTTTYDYDLLGGLRRVELADGTGVDYVLDGENRRVARIVDGETTHRWLYQDGLKIIAEVDADGEVVTRYVYASDDRVPDVMIREGRTYRILRDLLGSVRLVVDVATGDVAQELAYDPYGLVLRDTNPGFQPWGFAGGLHDHVTGLVRFGTRDYDPTTARWTAPDPLGFAPGQTNLYAYVGGDPVNRIDPLGGQYEVSSDAVAETMWALAYEEFRIGGHANMKDAYGTVDITEHALFGDPSLKSYAPPLPWNSAPYNHLIETGGRFLPERNHNIKLPNGNLLDLRWFMQGYLSDGLGQTWKTAGGHLYNGLDTTSDNAIINNMSLQAGMDAHNSGLSLADVAQSWVGDPPPGNAWRQGTSSLPGDAPPSYDYNPYW